MKIVLDGFGGDLAPIEPLQGAAAAVTQLGVTVVVTGDEKTLRETAATHQISLAGIEIVDAPRVMPIEAEPTKLLKEYADSSMAVGLQLVADGKADAFVSAGSTGALLVGATFLVKRVKGVKRPAIGALIPMAGGKFYLLVDAGANHDCRPEMLAQFAVMGSIYHERVMGVKHPRVGLVNIGTEETKGTVLQQESYPLLQALPGISFVGNIEARELPNDGCDVAVCDGFTGNVILKLSEGFSKFFGDSLKGIFFATVKTKLAALLLKAPVTAWKRSLDYKEYGGAPILGTRHPVIKAHGSSDARAFCNAIKQAKFCVEQDICGGIAAGIAATKEENA